jgi:hypothetical protein
LALLLLLPLVLRPDFVPAVVFVWPGVRAIWRIASAGTTRPFFSVKLLIP